MKLSLKPGFILSEENPKKKFLPKAKFFDNFLLKISRVVPG